jgi:hypothetical protein
VRVAMLKVDGVQDVRVSLNEGLTILELKAGNTVTLSALRQIVKNNGFVSKEAKVRARGTATSMDGKPLFDVSGTHERLVLTASPQSSGEEWVISVAPPEK